MEFEWSPAKARINLQKHRVSFDEARTVFADPLAMTILDTAEHEEERFITVGDSAHPRLIVVVHYEISGRIRIISARRATRRERNQYEEGEEKS